MIVLDTCTLLWLARGAGLPAEVEKRIAAADVVFVSAISALEIGTKAAKGRLVLPVAPSQWWPSVLDHHGLTEVPVDGAIALRATALPPIHGDPADRVIIATAQQLAATLYTPDPLIQAYPDVDVRWDEA